MCIRDRMEVVLLTRRRFPTIISMQVGAEDILTKKEVKYLGFKVDLKLSYEEQSKRATDKAHILIELTRLMVNNSHQCKQKSSADGGHGNHPGICLRNMN